MALEQANTTLKVPTQIKKVQNTPKYFEVILSSYSYMKIYKVWDLLNAKNFKGTLVDKKLKK